MTRCPLLTLPELPPMLQVRKPPPRAASRLGGVLRVVRRALPWLVVASLACAVATVSADGTDDRRARTGARLFRSLLAADVGLDHKATGGKLHVLVYAGESRTAASEIAALIAPPDDAQAARIRELPLELQLSATLPDDSEPAPAGVFLAARPPAPALEALVRWSIAHHVIVYSPFEGDVERGIPAGLAVEAKVQPYINLTTLEAAGIELKPFFLQVAKVHK